VQARRLGQHAGHRANALRVATELEAVDAGRAFRRTDEPGQHAHGGRLASPVRTEDAEDLAVAHRERQVMDRGQCLEVLGEPGRLDHRERRQAERVTSFMGGGPHPSRSAPRSPIGTFGAG
jgi:hypothetical protein